MQLSLCAQRLLAAMCVACVACAVLIACQAPSPIYPPNASPEIRDACTLTERRCTECHDHDRILDAHKTRDEWAATVERMRQMPGSTIRPDETIVILRCLTNRNDTPDPVSMFVR